jgi:hypothetical protein
MSKKVEVCLVIFLAIIVGIGYNINPLISLSPLLLMFLIAIIMSAEVRLLFLVFGSLFVLQSSSEWTTMKSLFVLGLLFITAISLLNLKATFENQRYLRLKPIITVSLFFGVYVLFIVLVSTFIWNAPLTSAIRGAYPYLMSAFIPLIALDIANKISKGYALVIFLVSGIVSSIIFSLGWLSNRAYIENLNNTEIGLLSYMISFALFSYSCAKLFNKGKNKILWGFLNVFILSSMLITGNRTGLIIFVIPLAIVLLGKRGILKKIGNSILYYVLVVAFGLLGVMAISNLIDSNLNAVIDRFVGLSKDLSIDQSYLGRYDQTIMAIELFRNSPFIGSGFGVNYYQIVSNFYTSMDSPLASLAKLGLIGLLFLAAIYFVFIRFLYAEIKVKGKSIELVALFGYIVISSVYAFIGPPLEDKGFSIGLLLILVMVINSDKIDMTGSFPVIRDDLELKWGA